LALSALVVAVLASGGRAAPAGTALLAAGLLVAAAVLGWLAAGCARLWARIRRRSWAAGATAPALAWSLPALALAAAEAGGLWWFAARTSAAGLLALAATGALDAWLLRVPPGPNAAGRKLLEGAAAHRAFLAGLDGPLSPEQEAYAVALGVGLPAGSEAERLVALATSSAVERAR
jgi:hypothetical protein